MKTVKGNAVMHLVSFFPSRLDEKQQHTVSKNEFCNSCKNHGNATNEVVVTSQSDQTGGWIGTLETTKDQAGGRVWDQESQEAQKGWVAFVDVSMRSIIDLKRYAKTHRISWRNLHVWVLQVGRTVSRIVQE